MTDVRTASLQRWPGLPEFEYMCLLEEEGSKLVEEPQMSWCLITSEHKHGKKDDNRSCLPSE